METMKSFILLGLLTGLFLLIGFVFGGIIGATAGLLLAFVMNFISYYFSDKIVLSLYRAKEISADEKKEIHKSVEKITEKMGIPKPKIYLVEMNLPNAFATGRNPENAAIAFTTGILDKLNQKELEGVISHELSHVKNRDTLISTMAATIGGAITWLAYMFYFGDNENRNGLSFILLFILAPLAATLIRLAISRSREYLADQTGATYANPLELASALEKISSYSGKINNPSTAHLFIVNNFSGSSVLSLFSTHPPLEDRVKRLRQMANATK